MTGSRERHTARGPFPSPSPLLQDRYDLLMPGTQCNAIRDFHVLLQLTGLHPLMTLVCALPITDGTLKTTKGTWRGSRP